MRVKERKDLTLGFWSKNVDLLLEFQGKDVLPHTGRISNKQMEKEVAEIYDDFNKRRKAMEAKQADIDDLDELNNHINEWIK